MKFIIIIIKKQNKGEVFSLRLSESVDEEYENTEVLDSSVIKVNTTDFFKYNIKNINNKYEVIKKVYEKLKDNYISNNESSKIIHNINTDVDIEIWKSGIKETFGNDKYYKNLPNEIKKAKIVTMEYLDELIKYSKKRAEDAKNYHNLSSDIKFSYLRIPIEIDNVIYYINIDIKNTKGINKFYIHYLQRKDFK